MTNGNIPLRVWTLLLPFGLDKIWSSGEIVAYASNKLGINPGSIMPADYDVDAQRPSAHSTRILYKTNGRGYKVLENPVRLSKTSTRRGEPVADLVARLESELAAVKKEKEAEKANKTPEIIPTNTEDFVQTVLADSVSQ